MGRVSQLLLRRRTVAVPLVLFFALTAGCAEAENNDPPGAGKSAKPVSGGSEGSAGGSCASMIKFGSRTYWGLRDLTFDTGDRLGTARMVPCDDSRERSTDTGMSDLAVYEVKGLDKTLAVGVDDPRGGVRLYAVRHGKKPPPEVLNFIKAAAS